MHQVEEECFAPPSRPRPAGAKWGEALFLGFGLAFCLRVGSIMAFLDLERRVKIFDFERKFHRAQWADFKISKSTDIWGEALFLGFGLAFCLRGGSIMAFRDL